MAIAKITSKGQLTVPRQVRDRLGVGPGDSLEFRFEDDHVVVTPVRQRQLSDFRGLFRVDHALDFDEERSRAWSEQTRRLTNENSSDRV
jgi:antitoxin PrlF